jgi:hypothetical protein
MRALVTNTPLQPHQLGYVPMHEINYNSRLACCRQHLL